MKKSKNETKYKKPGSKYKNINIFLRVNRDVDIDQLLLAGELGKR
jgi:hypothetical protein